MLNRHVRPLESTPRLSARGRLKFRWEKFSELVHELPPLLKAHWEEVAMFKDKAPLSLDVERYFQWEAMGVLGIVTARDEDKLVGYVFVLTGPHPHHATTLWAQIDGFYLAPEYRKGLAGYRMIRGTVAALRKKGVKGITALVKSSFEDGRVVRLFERLKFTTEDVLMTRML